MQVSMAEVHPNASVRNPKFVVDTRIEKGLIDNDAHRALLLIKMMYHTMPTSRPSEDPLGQGTILEISRADIKVQSYIECQKFGLNALRIC